LLPDYLWGIETSDCKREHLVNNASRLPMRNWNIADDSATSWRSTLPDYLWGIETNEPRLSRNFLAIGFQTTYEELKRISSPRTYIGKFRFQTTYEELKPSNVYSRLPFVALLPDYLWGIETVSDFAPFCPFVRFQTTYEELKPNMNFSRLHPTRMLPDYLWGIETGKPDRLRSWRCTRFQTTYEELKHRLAFQPARSRSRFQTTYEELKLFCTFEEWGNHLLPDYLWGIETQKGYFRWHGAELPDYLWGIETFPRSRAIRSVSASRLPMRNWNIAILQW